MVALLEGYEHRAMAFDQEYLHAKDQAEVGVLTETQAKKAVEIDPERDAITPTSQRPVWTSESQAAIGEEQLRCLHFLHSPNGYGEADGLEDCLRPLPDL